MTFIRTTILAITLTSIIVPPTYTWQWSSMINWKILGATVIGIGTLGFALKKLFQGKSNNPSPALVQKPVVTAMVPSAPEVITEPVKVPTKIAPTDSVATVDTAKQKKAAQAASEKYCKEFKNKLDQSGYRLFKDLITQIILGASRNEIDAILAQPEYQYRYNSIAEYQNDSDEQWEFRRLIAMADAFYSQESPLTQTEGSLFDYSIRQNILRNRTFCKEIGQLLFNIIKQEKELNKGPYTIHFFQTTQTDKYLCAFFHTRLLAKLIDTIDFTHFLMLRQPYSNMIPLENNAAAVRLREHYLANGCTNDRDSRHSFYLLSVAPSILIGLERKTSCPAVLFTQQHSGHVTLENNMWQSLFKAFNLNHLYLHYRDTLNKLNINNNLILYLALTPQAVEKCVYQAIPLGIKNKAVISTQDINDTTDAEASILALMNALKAAPHTITNHKSLAWDFQQRIILTPDLLLNPMIGPQHMQVYRYIDETSEVTLRSAEKQINQIVDDLYEKLKKDPTRLAHVRTAIMNFGFKNNSTARL